MDIRRIESTHTCSDVDIRVEGIIIIIIVESLILPNRNQAEEYFQMSTVSESLKWVHDKHTANEFTYEGKEEGYSLEVYR